MSFNGGQRTTIAAGVGLLAGGVAMGIHSVYRDDTEGALLATTVALIGLTVVRLVCARAWIRDTRDERRELALARHDADGDKMRYFALRAALESEATRTHRDLAAERSRNAAALVVERKAMRDEFEARRLEEAQEAFQTGVEMERSGALRPDAPIPANIITFPKQTPAHEPAEERSHERSREHGVVSP
ncbi:hypothetical protein ACFYRN_32045 [Streptomyces sp. NPDC005227]|uniref:hypothetical protein n=1 Tax=Streptomyces sp. NPDC005227 TaxID=3364707 RepID=UPI00368EBE8A